MRLGQCVEGEGAAFFSRINGHKAFSVRDLDQVFPATLSLKPMALASRLSSQFSCWLGRAQSFIVTGATDALPYVKFTCAFHLTCCKKNKHNLLDLIAMWGCKRLHRKLWMADGCFTEYQRQTTNAHRQQPTNDCVNPSHLNTRSVLSLQTAPQASGYRGHSWQTLTRHRG